MSQFCGSFADLISLSALTVILYSAAWADTASAEKETPNRSARAVLPAGTKQQRIKSSMCASSLPRLRGREGIGSVQREDEQVARVFEIVVFHRMQVAPARLHSEILFRPDRIGDGRTLERRADIEAPQLLQLLVVISDHPA